MPDEVFDEEDIMALIEKGLEKWEFLLSSATRRTASKGICMDYSKMFLNVVVDFVCRVGISANADRLEGFDVSKSLD